MLYRYSVNTQGKARLTGRQLCKQRNFRGLYVGCADGENCPIEYRQAAWWTKEMTCCLNFFRGFLFELMSLIYTDLLSIHEKCLRVQALAAAQESSLTHTSWAAHVRTTWLV